MARRKPHMIFEFERDQLDVKYVYEDFGALFIYS